MTLNPLDARYIVKMKPVCRDCGATARWRLLLEDPAPGEGKFVEFCTEHAPVSPHDITDVS